MTDREIKPVRMEPSPKRVRAYLGGELVADSRRPVLVWEIPYYPAYYFPAGDVLADLVPTGRTEASPERGEAQMYDVKTDRAVAEAAARRYAGSAVEELRNLVHLDWAAMDEWFEEDEPVYTHPRNPYSRVDVLASTRHVRVEVDGQTVAESRSPRILFETGLPPRYYLPLTDLRMDLLRPSTTETHCPYKGMATYWSLQLGDTTYDDFVWTYRAPLPESQKVAGLAAFLNEKVDIYLDGELQERPDTHFS
jgi:uncharacterized protein (DUF427 family)